MSRRPKKCFGTRYQDLSAVSAPSSSEVEGASSVGALQPEAPESPVPMETASSINWQFLLSGEPSTSVDPQAITPSTGTSHMH
jgi:hypothetical protein